MSSIILCIILCHLFIVSFFVALSIVIDLEKKNNSIGKSDKIDNCQQKIEAKRLEK